MKGTRALPETFGYLLTKLGQEAFERFSEKLAPHGLRPRHCGVLAMLDARPMSSQQMLGEALGVVPSAVVGMIDDLERLNAITRADDPDDRRRFRLALTADGKRLLKTVTALANDVDAELVAPFKPAQAEALHAMLATLLESRASRGQD